MKTPLLLATLLALSALVRCDAADLGKPSLAGLHGIFVVVPPLPDAVREGGLTDAKVREVAESILKTSGISSRKEPAAEDGEANLVITIDTIRHPKGIYLFQVQVSVVQMVHLARAPKSAPVPAATWSTNAFGLTTPTKMDIIELPLKEKLGDFVQAFRSVNAR